jgi:hypothetical protein
MFFLRKDVYIQATVSHGPPGKTRLDSDPAQMQ